MVPRDILILGAVRDRTFITRQQLDVLAQDQEHRTNRSRRVRRLSYLKQLEILPQCFPYPGRVLAITHDGLMTLQMTGQAMLCVTAETITPSLNDQIAHYLGINEIEITARRVFKVKSWTGDRALKSLNIEASDRTSKDYDSVMDIESPDEPSLIIRVGIEYERTIKAKERYAEIRKSLNSESQLSCLLYFTDTEGTALRISKLVYSQKFPIGVVVLSNFHSAGINSTVRIVSGNTVHALPLWQFLSGPTGQ